jgi:hypothetical protein
MLSFARMFPCIMDGSSLISELGPARSLTRSGRRHVVGNMLQSLLYDSSRQGRSYLGPDRAMARPGFLPRNFLHLYMQGLAHQEPAVTLPV